MITPMSGFGPGIDLRDNYGFYMTLVQSQPTDTYCITSAQYHPTINSICLSQLSLLPSVIGVVRLIYLGLSIGRNLIWGLGWAWVGLGFSFLDWAMLGSPPMSLLHFGWA